MRHFLSTAEFASLCGTTKATLFHYDKIGLLKPAKTGSNGYRSYLPDQYIDFEFITTLKETGSSLEEIIRTKEIHDAGKLIELLGERKNYLKNLRQKLFGIELSLEDLVTGLYDYNNQTWEEFNIEEQKAIYLECVPAPKGRYDTMQDAIKQYIMVVKTQKDSKNIPRAPFGSILDLQGCYKKEYRMKYYFSKAIKNTISDRRYLKCSGKYLTFSHRGEHNTHLEIIDEILSKLDKDALKPKSDIYCFDLIDYMINHDIYKYSVKYCIQI